MTPAKHNLPWYAEWTERCAKTWGVPVVIVGVALAFAWVYGGKFVDAKITVDASNAQTFATVADAVQKLTAMEQEDREFQKKVSAEHAKQIEVLSSAQEMMKDVPNDRKESNRLLGENGRLLSELVQVLRLKIDK